ncbi:MAG: AAA family ATPase [Candidatus Accumulibacter sp.]|jgi:MoxR-like ATPase|nr:AAA family ATPase [Accumulibacter sp.]
MTENRKLTEPELARAGEQLAKIIANVEKAIIGKRRAIELVLITLLARGHVLIEDVPGVGKTSLIFSIAKSVDCGFKRIQFTPDIMPSDVTGFSVYNQKSGEFEFRSGSVMSHLILADEINRASAKTQSALLEAMEEKQVTVDSVSYALPEPFMVMATQNPLESFGTYPLPEAQIDRFLLKLTMGYPNLDEERRIVSGGREAKASLGPVVTHLEILELIGTAGRVWVSPDVERYIVEIVAATRSNPKISLGGSPRGSLSLCAAAKALALLNGRGHVYPDDVKYLAPFVLGHRIILSQEANSERVDANGLVRDIVDSIVAPI